MTQALAQNSWGKGEISPWTRGRIDTELYYSSAESLKNMLVRPSAVPVRRAGTKHAGEVRDSTQDVRLIEFVFSVEQSYIIEMGNFYLRMKDSSGQPVIYDLDSAPDWADATVYTSGTVVEQSSSVPAWVSGNFYFEGGYVTNGGDTYISIASRIAGTTNEPGVGIGWELVWELVLSQHSYFICIKDHTSEAAVNEPQTGTDWEDFWYEMALAGGLTGEWEVEVTTPYSEAQIWDVDYAQKDDVIKMTHQSHDIGELRRYADNVWAFVQGVIEGPPWAEKNQDKDVKIKSANKAVGGPYAITATGGDVFVAEDVERFYRIGPLNDAGEQGFVEILTVADPQTATGNVIVELKNNSFHTDWSRNAFFEGNYPAHVTYHEARLELSNTPEDPQKKWFSKSFLYNDFNTGDTDEDGFDLTINSEQANPIKWVASAKASISGTFGSEFVTLSPTDGSLNNGNKNAKQQSGWGGEFIRPRKIGNRVYYVQRGFRKLREFYYVWDEDNYDASDMTELADHITISGIKDMDYQRNQDSLLWCVLENGKGAVLSRHHQSEIMAWTPIVTDGDIKSIRFIPNPDGFSDRGFMIVERTFAGVNGGDPVKYIEYFDNHVIEDDTTQLELFYVDSGVKYVSIFPTTDDFTGLEHLEGETVDIFVDGVDWGTGTVSGGEVTNPAGAWNVAAVGLNFESIVQQNPLNSQTQTGTAKGKIRRINELSIDMYKTLGVEYSSDGTKWYPVGVPEGVDKTVLFTGIVPNLTFTGDLDYKGAIYLKQTRPYSMNILGIYPQVAFNG
jgi:hypothetical protein